MPAKPTQANTLEIKDGPRVYHVIIPEGYRHLKKGETVANDKVYNPNKNEFGPMSKNAYLGLDASCFVLAIRKKKLA